MTLTDEQRQAHTRDGELITLYGTGVNGGVAWGRRASTWIRHDGPRTQIFATFDEFIEAFVREFVSENGESEVVHSRRVQGVDIRLSIAQVLVRLAMKISSKSVELMWR